MQTPRFARSRKNALAVNQGSFALRPARRHSAIGREACDVFGPVGSDVCMRSRVRASTRQRARSGGRTAYGRLVSDRRNSWLALCREFLR